MTASALGYAVIQATDIAAWRKFGTEILGLMPVESKDGSIRFRMDERPFRIAVVPGSEDRFMASGWEMANPEIYDATLKSLADAGVAIEHGSADEAADRRVRALARCKDPSGNLLEIYHGRVYDYAPFISPVGVSGFVTGNMGLGHVVLPAPKVEETRSFYKTYLGFGDTDEMRVPIGVPDHPGLALYFLHAGNPRHHSVALFEADIPGGLVHVMIEVKEFDDLGRCIDRCKKAGTPISIDMGRHSNDLMVSTYIKTPAGFDVEYGWDGWQVDWNDYVPTKSEIFSLWGHPQMNGG